MTGPIGVRAGLFQCRGDWIWFKWMFGFKGWQSDDHVWWRCKANRSSMPFWDPNINAKWRKHRCSQREFARLIQQNGQSMSPLFSLPGFTMLFICIDVLHALDLGMAQEIIGNIFWESLGTFAKGKNKEAQLSDLQFKMKAHYSRMKTMNRIGNLTRDMVRSEGKSPKLKAKGAETRHVVPFALEIATALHAQYGNKHSENVLRCVSGLMDLYMTFGIRPFPTINAQKATQTVATAYVELNKEAVKLGNDLWRIKPKIHMFMELGFFQSEELGDPMNYWCYKDEDYMGYVSNIAESRGGPRAVYCTALRVLNRVRLLHS